MERFAKRVDRTCADIAIDDAESTKNKNRKGLFVMRFQFMNDGTVITVLVIQLLFTHTGFPSL